jgi:hypothetical protein
LSHRGVFDNKAAAYTIAFKRQRMIILTWVQSDGVQG